MAIISRIFKFFKFPTWMMAHANKSSFSGISNRLLTECPPALSPNIVTKFGSPPKSRIFSWTHLSAICWSFRPKFPNKEKNLLIPDLVFDASKELYEIVSDLCLPPFIRSSPVCRDPRMAKRYWTVTTICHRRMQVSLHCLSGGILGRCSDV